MVLTATMRRTHFLYCSRFGVLLSVFTCGWQDLVLFVCLGVSSLKTLWICDRWLFPMKILWLLFPVYISLEEYKNTVFFFRGLWFLRLGFSSGSHLSSSACSSLGQRVGYSSSDEAFKDKVFSGRSSKLPFLHVFPLEPHRWLTWLLLLSSCLKFLFCCFVCEWSWKLQRLWDADGYEAGY